MLWELIKTKTYVVGTHKIHLNERVIYAYVKLYAHKMCLSKPVKGLNMTISFFFQTH